MTGIITPVMGQEEDFEILRTLQVGDKYVYKDEKTGQVVEFEVYEKEETGGAGASIQDSVIKNKANANDTSLLGVFPVESSQQFPERIGLDLEIYGPHFELNYTSTDDGNLLIHGYEKRSIVADVGEAQVIMENATLDMEFETKDRPLTPNTELYDDLVYNLSFSGTGAEVAGSGANVMNGGGHVNMEFIVIFNSTINISQPFQYDNGTHKVQHINVSESHDFFNASVYLSIESMEYELNRSDFNVSKGWINSMISRETGIPTLVEKGNGDGFYVDREDEEYGLRLKLSQQSEPERMWLVYTSFSVAEYTTVTDGSTFTVVVIDGTTYIDGTQVAFGFTVLSLMAIPILVMMKRRK